MIETTVIISAGVDIALQTHVQLFLTEERLYFYDAGGRYGKIWFTDGLSFSSDDVESVIYSRWKARQL